MTDHNAVAWFFINCLKYNVKKVADMGAILSASGLLSRGYMDAMLPENLIIDTWEQKDISIFPAQRLIYDQIFELETYPQKIYDMIFFLRNAHETKKEMLKWALRHGKRLIFMESVPYSLCQEIAIEKDEITEISYQGNNFFEINMLEKVHKKIETLIEQEKDAEVIKYVLEHPLLLEEDIFLLKAVIGISAANKEYEKMWNFVKMAYRVAPEDTDLEPLYKNL